MWALAHVRTPFGALSPSPPSRHPSLAVCARAQLRHLYYISCGGWRASSTIGRGGAQLTLCWSKRPPDTLHTVDGGRSFVGVGGFKFRLQCADPAAPPLPPWLRRAHALSDYTPGLRVHVLGVAAVKAAVDACESMGAWTANREVTASESARTHARTRARARMR
jgi:hypothetical protein